MRCLLIVLLAVMCIGARCKSGTRKRVAAIRSIEPDGLQAAARMER